MGSWFQSLRKTRERFSGALKGLFAAPQPDGATAEELADLLITADVPLRLVQTLSKELEKAASRREPLRDTFRRLLVSALGRNPELDWAAPPVTAPAPSDLRDAMAEEDACSSALKRLRELNAKALDLKARYWAAKLKDPSFSLASLTRNPGSELQDRAARRGFYDLLAGYHAGGRAPLLTAGERQQLEAFMKRENEVLGRCGSR